ncbi:hypothetical protein [uncultured Brevundimonas sp.]|uniref:hypothetical protein n=1 Tax=uncultured Brevundimonas sp. TaxID=213418 RepID=UPI0025E71014|nr:hypothetical protein [uncultured Brevundimonas sp.]
MFKRRTTLIIGAGCSAEYKLPIGDGLKDHIADELGRMGRQDRNNGFVVISSRGSDEVLLNAVVQAGQRRRARDWHVIANGMAPGIRHASSIDRYLHLHRDNEAIVTIGKVAIARSILAAEQDSHLGRDSIDLPGIKNALGGQPHWLQQLVFRLQEDVSLESMMSMFSNMTIITFNYDRIIEHYLFHAVQDLGGFDPQTAAQIMTGLKIIHPYGKIGRLPWQKEPGDALPFGHWENLHWETVIQAGERLRTFTETIEEDDLIDAIKGAVNHAEQIVFMGFSFLPQNLDLMGAESESSASSIWATSYMESESNVRAASKLIKKMLRGKARAQPGDFEVQWVPLKAGEYLRNFGNELAS